MLSHEEHYSIEIEERARHQRIKDDEIKREIEAALFKARRILSLEEICKLFPKIQKTKILELTYELIDEYKEVQTALEIVELADKRFELKIKDPIDLIEKLLKRNKLKIIRRGIYLVIPFSSINKTWSLSEFEINSYLLKNTPYYIGLFNAFYLHHFTGQIPNKMFVLGFYP